MIDVENYELRIRTVGNPDFGQYAPVAPATTLRAGSFAELLRRVDEHINFYDIGGGNWTFSPLKKGGKLLGYMSYNRRVWKTKKYPSEEVVVS